MNIVVSIAIPMFFVGNIFPNEIENTERLFEEKSLALYAQVGDSDYVRVIPGEEWPEETITSINIGRMDGKTRLIGVYPVSESGDWYFGTINIFDEKEKFIGYKVILSHFNSICFDESIHRIKVYQEVKGKMTLIKSSVTTPDGKDLSNAICENPYTTIKPVVIRKPLEFEEKLNRAKRNN